MVKFHCAFEVQVCHSVDYHMCHCMDWSIADSSSNKLDRNSMTESVFLQMFSGRIIGGDYILCDD